MGSGGVAPGAHDLAGVVDPIGVSPCRAGERHVNDGKRAPTLHIAVNRPGGIRVVPDDFSRIVHSTRRLLHC